MSIAIPGRGDDTTRLQWPFEQALRHIACVNRASGGEFGFNPIGISNRLPPPALVTLLTATRFSGASTVASYGPVVISTSRR